MLVRADGLDDALVIFAGGPGQRRVLALLLGLLRLLLGLGGNPAPVALVDRVDAALQEVAGVARQVAGGGEAFASLGGAAAAGDAEPHLAPAAGGGREPEHPTGGLAANPEQQSATIGEVALGGVLHLLDRQLVKVRRGSFPGHLAFLGWRIPPALSASQSASKR